jgi:hypothetical protein
MNLRGCVTHPGATVPAFLHIRNVAIYQLKKTNKVYGLLGFVDDNIEKEVHI